MIHPQARHRQRCFAVRASRDGFTLRKFCATYGDFAEGTVNHDAGILRQNNKDSKNLNKGTREAASDTAGKLTPDNFPNGTDRKRRQIDRAATRRFAIIG